jgi:hypothetical protein
MSLEMALEVSLSGQWELIPRLGCQDATILKIAFSADLLPVDD